jgi:hypothetical protein
MNSEMSVESQIVENVLRELDKFSQRIAPTNTAESAHTTAGALN